MHRDDSRTDAAQDDTGVMTEQDAQPLSDVMERDQTSEAFRDMARNIAAYYRALLDGGMKHRDARDLTADLQSVYACKMLGVEL